MPRAVKPPDWEQLLADAALLQTKLPGAATHYDSAIAALESIVGWRTKRRIHGKLVLGEINSIDAGLRNQRRSAPLETITVELSGRRILKLPTVEEMLRIKAYLIVERNATRDYLDVAALSHHLGLRESARALDRMNELYAEFAGEGGDMLSTIVVKLSSPDPYDLTEVNLGEYKGIVAPWNDWRVVESQCRSLALALLEEPQGP
jgi:hypothetical protein